MNNIGSADNEKLLDLFNDMESETLILRPTFQRNLVWNNSHKENFLDTILRGFPFPEIYLADGEIDLETRVSKRVVVDGQQRLDTIFSYINGDISTRTIPLFQDLTPKQQTDFYDYKIVVRDLGRLDDNQIVEIFKRINSVSYALNAMEINNALYKGIFISTAQDVQNSDSFTNLEMFSQNQYARMKDTEYVLLIMATLEEGGYFTGNSEIERYIKLYNDEYPNSETIKNELIDTCQLLLDLDLEYDSIWWRKTSFFTLIVELIKLIREGLEFKNLKQALEDLENHILLNKSNDPESNSYAKFYNYIFQGTSGRAGRIARATVLESELRKAGAKNSK